LFLSSPQSNSNELNDFLVQVGQSLPIIYAFALSPTYSPRKQISYLRKVLSWDCQRIERPRRRPRMHRLHGGIATRASVILQAWHERKIAVGASVRAFGCLIVLLRPTGPSS
jgi:hypothetical protein